MCFRGRARPFPKLILLLTLIYSQCTKRRRRRRRRRRYTWTDESRCQKFCSGCDTGGFLTHRIPTQDRLLLCTAHPASRHHQQCATYQPRDTIIRAQPCPSEPQTSRLRISSQVPTPAPLRYLLRGSGSGFVSRNWKKCLVETVSKRPWPGLLVGRGHGPYLCFKPSPSISLFSFPLSLSYPSHLSGLVVVLPPSFIFIFRFFPLLHSLLNIHTFIAGQQAKFSQQR
jgi:hypothetical protein